MQLQIAPATWQIKKNKNDFAFTKITLDCSYYHRRRSSLKVPAVEECMELAASGAPQSTVDEAVRVRRVVPDAVKHGRRFRFLLQPISDDRGVT